MAGKHGTGRTVARGRRAGLTTSREGRVAEAADDGAVGAGRRALRAAVGAAVLVAALVSCSGGGTEQVAPPAEPAERTESATITPTTWSFEGFDVVAAVPDDPVGLVHLFHGSHGSADFATRAETVEVLDELVSRGYGYVATESTERTGDRRWDVTDPSPATNPDLGRLERLQRRLVATTAVTDATPLLGLGMSNGALFASLWGETWAAAGAPVRSVALVMGPVARPVVAGGGLHVPALFVTAENDTISRPERIVADHDATAARGVTTDLVIAEEQPLTASAFQGLPGLDEDDAGAVVDALVATGSWDADGTRLLPVEEVVARVAAADLPPSLRSVRREVRDRCAVVLAAHQMRGDLAVPVADFFDAARG
jgi:hypothetical protein